MKALYSTVIASLRRHYGVLAVGRLGEEHAKLETLRQITPKSSFDSVRVLTSFGLSDFAAPIVLQSLESTLEYHREHKTDIQTCLDYLIAPFKELRAILEHQIPDSSTEVKSLIMCTECESRSAVTKCDQCKDEFCHLCFEKVHVTGNRRFHSSIEIPQLVCVGCDQRFATQQCLDCALFFCETCFPSIHAKRPEFVKHRKRNIAGRICNECEESQATLLCENCHDIFCAACFTVMHRRGNRKSHSYVVIDPSGFMYRKGAVLDQSETKRLLDWVRFGINADRINS